MSRPKTIKQEQIDAEKAFERHQMIGKRELLRRKLLAENILDLNEMYESQGYKAILGLDPPPQWSSYLGQVEVYYSRAEVERYRKIVQALVKTWGYNLDDFLDIPVTRLEDISKIIMDKNFIGTTGDEKERIDELFFQARNDASQDWRDTIAEFKGEQTSYDCQHKNMQVFEICSKCGKKVHVNVKCNNESEDKTI